MRTILALVTVSLCMAIGASAQHPVATHPLVEISGKIRRVQISAEQGTPPYLEINEGSATTKVYLCSMRYLIEHNFNPKVGQSVTVKGYRVEGNLVAATVTIVEENRVLKFRDENGRPLWRTGSRNNGMKTTP